MRSAVAILLVAASSIFVGPGRAEASPTTQAEDFFQRGKAYMLKGDYARACPLLAESYRLDPAGGTLQNLAICNEEIGNIATAYARFEELRELSTNAVPPRRDRVKLADEHIAKLTPRLTRIRVQLPRAKPVPGMSVRIDGVTYEEAAWSAGILVDLGTHTVEFSAPRKKPFETTFVVTREGVLETLDAPPLEDLPQETTPPAPLAQLQDLDEIAAQRARRTTGFVIGGVGLATLAGGTVFGVLTITTNNAGKAACRRASNPSADPTDFDPVTGQCYVSSGAYRDANAKKDDARTFANVANVLVPLGLVGLALGTYLVLRGATPTGRAAAPGVSARLVPSRDGVLVEGSF